MSVIYHFQPNGVEINKIKYPVTGIDISKHNGPIEFKLIKEQKIDFVYMKATEGGDYVDSSFDGNFKKAIKNKLHVGAYHFFRFNVSGKTQAANLYGAIKGKELVLPPAIDVEDWGNPGKYDKKEVILELHSFVDEIEKLTNRHVIIYTNENGFRKYIKGNFDNRLWICSFNSEPKVNSRWVFWQHSHKGKIEGANSRFDLNTFNGSRSEWIKYLQELKKD